MKFSLKVFLSTLTLITLALSVGSFLLISSVFDASLNQEVRLALEENQMLRFSFLTAASNSGGKLTDSAARRLAQSLESASEYSSRRLRLCSDEGESLYASDGVAFDQALLPQTGSEQRTWIILSGGDGSYQVQSACQVEADGRTFFLENMRDVSSVFQQRDAHFSLYRTIICAILACAALIALLLTHLLTAPIRSLSRSARRFARGDYGQRAPLRSRDEIGLLTRDFNSMADSLERKIHELEEAARRREDFMASFAHELKTPLTAVIGYADTLRSKALPPEVQQRAASYIFTEGKRLEALSLKLLELIVAQRSDISRENIPASSLFQEAKEMLIPILTQSGIKLEVSWEESDLYVEPDLIKTLLFNLCDNARKASPPGSTVFLTGARTAGGYLLSVRDQGRGMSADILDKITEPFFMADKSRARAQNGAGLGLALCDTIARLHDTTLCFQSAPGQGTLVTLLLKGGAAS